MMITTFFGAGTLDSTGAFVVALLVGLVFGVALERAGFGSSRRLAGIFYFRDLAVLKVMFTAMVTAMLGLSYLTGLDVLPQEQLFLLPTTYGAQIVGGLIFGVGFVMSGWCPGTAAVGLASGRIDALVFLAGAIGGSVLFNELYATLEPLTQLGARGVRFAWEDLGIPHPVFAAAFVLVAVGCFWVSEYVERRRAARLAPAYAITGRHFGSPFMRAFSVALVLGVAPLFLLDGAAEAASDSAPDDAALLASVANGDDHIEPEELADRLVGGDPRLLVVDVRTADEYARFHIRGAVHSELADLPTMLAPHKGRRQIVLYSNGMTHPAQARDALVRQGFQDVFVLTDGLRGFIERCLKPVSLRAEAVPADLGEKIGAWRSYFYSQAAHEPPSTQDTPLVVHPRTGH